MRRIRLNRVTLYLFATMILSSLIIPASAGTLYKIRNGDTLWEIAAKHHTTVDKIAKANSLNENATLSLGKTIRIPTKCTPHRNINNNYICRTSAVVHTNVESACLRSGPGTKFGKISMLAKGSTGKTLASKGKWTKIALANGACGYVYSSLIAKGAGTISSAAPSQTPAASPDTKLSSDNSSLIQTALACRGARYRRGGTSRGGFDCSGFTRYIFAKHGVRLPHSSAAQAGLGSPVSRNDLRSGDLVFFHTYRRTISHVGIYIGNGQFVHAATHGRGVTVDSLNSGYYSPRYRGARRVN